MSKNTVSIKLTGNNRQLKGVLKQSEQDLNQFANTSLNASTRAAGGYTKVRKGVESISNQLNRLQNVGSLMIGVGIAGGGVRQIIDATAAYQDLQTRLKRLTKTQHEYAESQRYLSQLAGRHNKNLNTLAGSYSRILTLENAGMVNREQGRAILEGMSNAASALGASNAQLEQSMYGMAQGFSAGILRAEELNQVTEPLPGLLQELDKAAGLTSGGFRKLVVDGKVTSSMFRDTLIDALKSYEGAAADTADNMSAKLANLENSFIKLTAASEHGVDATLGRAIDAMAFSVNALANNLDVAQDAAIGLAAVMAGRLSIAAQQQIVKKHALMVIEKQRQTLELKGLQKSQQKAAFEMAAAEAHHARVRKLTITEKNHYAVVNVLTKAQVRLTAAETANAAATNALAAANKRYTLTARVATRAAAALRGTMAFLGGPLGVAMLAGYAIYEFANRAEEASPAVKALREENDKLNESLTKLTENQVKKQFNNLKAQITDSVRTMQDLMLQSAEKEKQATNAYKANKITNVGTMLTAADRAYFALTRDAKNLTNDALEIGEQIKIQSESLAALGGRLDELKKEREQASQQSEKQRSDQAKRFIESLQAEQIQLAAGKRALFEYKLAKANTTPAEAATALAIYDNVQALKAQQKQTAEALKESQQLSSWYQNYQANLTPATAAQAEFNATLEKLNQLLNSTHPEIKISQADYDKALAAAKSKRDKAIAESKKKTKAELTEMQSLYWETTKRIDAVMADSWKNMDRGFEGVVDGMKKAFKNMLAEMAHAALTRPITLQLQNSIASVGTNVATSAAVNVATTGASTATTAGASAAAFNPVTAAIAVGGLVVMNQLEKMQKADDERMKRFTAEYRQKHQNTGTVLGDIYAQSHSVSELTENLGKIGTDALSVNRDMYLSLLRIEQGIAKVTNGVARTLTRKGGLESFEGTTQRSKSVDAYVKYVMFGGGLSKSVLGTLGLSKQINQFSNWVSKGIYNKSTSLQDAGLSINSQRLQDILSSGMLAASQYQQIKTTRSYAFGLHKESSSHAEYSKLDESIKYQLGAVFKNANDVFRQFNKELGLGLQSTISNLKIDGSKLSLKGLKGEALSKALESYLSNTLDNWSDSFLKAGGLDRLTTKYQQAGEGQFQTLGRLVAQSRAWQQITNKLGLQFNATKVQALEFTQQLATQAGSFDKLQGLTAAYYDKFYSQDEKQAALKRQLNKIFGELNAPLPNTREQFRKMVESLNLTTQAGQKQYTEYMKLAPALDRYLTGLKEQNSALDSLGGALAKNSGAWLTHFKKLDEWGKKEHQRIRGEYQERIRLAGETERLVKTLGGWLTEIKLGDLSTSTPAQKLALAKSEYEQTLAKAQGGDNTAAAALKDLAQRYLKVADGFYGRNAQYQAIYNDILAKVDGVKNSLAAGQSVENLTREMNNKMQAVKDHIAQQLTLAGQQAQTQKNQLEVLKALPQNLSDSLAKILGIRIQRDATSAPVMHGSHAKGLDRVPFDGYRAELHKGEMVLPAGMAQLLRNSPGQNNNKDLIDEIRQLRAELAELKAEQARANNKAEQQRGHNIDATEQVARHTRQNTQVSV